MTTPTLKQINDFIANVEADMPENEFADWMALSATERQAIAWSAWVALNNAA